MKLKDAIKDINVNIIGNEDIEVNEIHNDSRKIKPGYIFAAIDGFNTKGIKFLKSAISNGTNCVLLDEKYYVDIEEMKKEDEIYNITYIFSKRVLKDMAIIAKNIYGDSSKDMKVIGITGTKGKTTVSTIIAKTLEDYGKNVLLIGTNGALLNGEQLYYTERTTLESFENQKLFKIAKEKNTQYIVLEVSSQAMIKDRVYGIDFFETTFTNFSEDHISEFEHPDLESYFEAKINALNLSKTNIINLDDENVKRALDILKENQFITFGKIDENKNENKQGNIEKPNIGFKLDTLKKGKYWEVEIQVEKGIYKDEYIGKYILKNNIPGIFSIYNSLAIMANLMMLNVPMENILEGIKTHTVPSRFERQENDLDLNIYLDFAHTEESYRQILKTANEMKKGRIIYVWGADGNRDKLKRPKMAEVVEEYADINIMCPCDLFGEETFEEVLVDMKKGLKNPEAKTNISFMDRKEAIMYAIDIMEKDDLLFIVGKYPVPFINTNEGRVHFDEKEIIKEAIDKKKQK